ncbi:hypothetical protein RRF57_008280 [Xylaria bambusicola]|uniref:Uncharacterized protein n=1 Tax=Xylaria bambusicola TaxID=326684 RepID=A0AAN7UTP5_9PEZI
MEVTFLPRGSKHHFQITRLGGCENRNESFRYQFTYKVDRENFQAQVRMRQSLQMIQVVRINRSKEENIAMNVHLKVWAGNEQEIDPTLSFASLSKNEPNHNVEYTVRWFKREPERKGDKRLILRPYSEDTDLNYGPTTSEKSSTFKDLKRRVSIGSNTSSISNSHVLFYEGKGVPAPDHVRKLGYLDIEFESLGR